jgi:hypothetical protein
LAIEVVRIGATRLVFLWRGLAFKLPATHSWRNFLNGLLANMTERACGRVSLPGFCPVVFSLAGGFLVVMRRARPLTPAEWAGFDPVAFCLRGDYSIPAEPKEDSFGVLDGAIVAIDYGGGYG